MVRMVTAALVTPTGRREDSGLCARAAPGSACWLWPRVSRVREIIRRGTRTSTRSHSLLTAVFSVTLSVEATVGQGCHVPSRTLGTWPCLAPGTHSWHFSRRVRVGGTQAEAEAGITAAWRVRHGRPFPEQGPAGLGSRRPVSRTPFLSCAAFTDSLHEDAALRCVRVGRGLTG